MIKQVCVIVLCLFSVCSFFYLAVDYGVCAVQPEAFDGESTIDAVWAKSDELQVEIFYSIRSRGVWSEPQMVTDDHYDNMYPVIDRDSTGRRWLVWAAYHNGTMELRYTSGKDGEWENSVTLASDMKSNTAPSVVVDKQDTVWVVWAANDGKYDDIYYSFHKNGTWSEPERVHEENNTFDVLPVVELDADDVPIVSWRSLQDERYINVASSWDGSQFSDFMVLEDIEKEVMDQEEPSPGMVELPAAIRQGAMVFIRVYER